MRLIDAEAEIGGTEMERCALCGDYYVDELIYRPIAMRRPFHIGHDGFVCPDCINDFDRMSPDGQYKLLREAEKRRMIEQKFENMHM